MAQDQIESSMQELYVVPPPRDVRDNGRRSKKSGSLRCCCNRVMEGESECKPHLPDEVLGIILAFLPLVSILKCRLVGKRWNRVSQQALFRETYARVSGELSLEYIQLLQKSPGFADSQVVSSAGGLLLVSSFVDSSDQLYVVNPTTATVKQIPAMLGLENSDTNKHDFSVVGMVMDSETNVYKILAAQEGARPVKLQIYDSSHGHGAWQWAGTWSVRQAWSRAESTSSLDTYLHEECYNVNLVSFHILDVVLHDGALHCLSVRAARQFLVLRFDPGSNRWDQVPGLFPPTPATSICDFRCRPVLLENEGRLGLAGAQVTGPISIRVTVWEHDDDREGGAQWREVASAQQQVEEEDPDVCGASYLDNTFFYLDACGDHLCLGAFPSLRNPDPKVLIYNLLQDSSSLSKLAEEEAEKKLVYWQKRAFFYEPRNVHPNPIITVE